MFRNTILENQRKLRLLSVKFHELMLASLGDKTNIQKASADDLDYIEYCDSARKRLVEAGAPLIRIPLATED